MNRLVRLLVVVALGVSACTSAPLGRANDARVVPTDTDVCALLTVAEVGNAVGGTVSAAPDSSLDHDLPGGISSAGCRYSGTSDSAGFALTSLVVGDTASNAAEVFNLSRGPLVTGQRKDVSGLGDGAFYDAGRHLLHVLRYNTILLVGAVPAGGDTSQGAVLPVEESLARTALRRL